MAGGNGSERRTRRGRSSRVAARTAAPLPSAEQLTPRRRIPTYELLDDPALEHLEAHAEAMTGIALTQLVRPGSPMIYGNFLTTMDLRSGAPTFGTAESTLAT